MRWLHLSDIHYNPTQSGTNSKRLLKKLPIFLRENRIVVDAIFVTGDFRHALYQEDNDVNASNTAAFILEVAESVGVTDSTHIHLVPGNHDLTRCSSEEEMEKFFSIRKNYNPNTGIIKKDDVSFLLRRFSFYDRVVNKLNVNNLKLDLENACKIHSSFCDKSYNILYLNTAITCGSDDDEGKMVLGNSDLYDTLEEINENNPNAPIIALGHHGIYNFTEKERKTIENLFSDYNITAYLCGDNHEAWCRKIGSSTIEITMGCLKYEEGSQVVFSVGEIEQNGNIKSIKSYNWDCVFFNWDVYSHFNNHISKLLLKEYTDIERSVKMSINVTEQKGTLVANSSAYAQQDDFLSLLLKVFFAHSWVESNVNDANIISDLLSVPSYNEIIDDLRLLIAKNNSPLKYGKAKFERNYSFKIKDSIIVWESVAPMIFEKDLETYKNALLKVFGAGKYEYSANMRNGLATSLAIIANHQDDIVNLGKYDVENFIYGCLNSLCPWDEEMKWEAFDDVIKLFAEACPSFFLNKLEVSLDDDSNELIGTIDNKRLSNTVHIIINVLKMLAIESQYLDKSIALLGKMYLKYLEIDNNEIVSAMAYIYLPWIPHTMASLDEQITSIRMLYNETPNACCKMLLQLIPGKITCSDGGKYYSWRNAVPENWYDRKILKDDYIETSKKFCELLLEYGRANDYLLIEIINNIENFILFDDSIKFLQDKYNSLSENERLDVWHAMDEVIAKHTYHCNADWAMTKEQLDQLNQVKELYTPDDLVEISLHLFSYHAYTYQGIYSDRSSSSEQEDDLNRKRIDCVKKLFELEGIDGLKNLVLKADNVHSISLATVDSGIEMANNDIMNMLMSESNTVKRFVLYYINSKAIMLGVKWAKKVNISEWKPDVKVEYFLALPFNNTYWLWAETELGEYSRAYWSKLVEPRFQDDLEHDYAVEKLLNCDNVSAAIICLWSDIKSKKHPDTDLVIKTLFKTTEEVRIDTYYISDLVNHLQHATDVDFETLANIEYDFYEMLGYDVAPSSLNRKISMQPDFFIDLTKRRYRLTPYDAKNDDDWKKIWRVVDGWNVVPGTDKMGVFSEKKLNYWINDVQKKAATENISEYTDTLIGGVLIHAPKDSNDIPIAPVARFLEKNNKALSGFRTKMFNSRGVHGCSSEAELKLADKYYKLKNAAKENGYRRLSEMYGNFEENHRQEAVQFASESK